MAPSWRGGLFWNLDFCLEDPKFRIFIFGNFDAYVFSVSNLFG